MKTIDCSAVHLAYKGGEMCKNILSAVASVEVNLVHHVSNLWYYIPARLHVTHATKVVKSQVLYTIANRESLAAGG